ncbi:Spindle assembly abnormal protein 6-like [Papilio machaon]|uniref:Spindle assembly abnormal protein 6-like n=1 Tax=Papilio machaon TaxID=76193 RepID=A0A194QTV0_PAPMA|nr:Spindle assembly abnormal protein 6-like [Papilio machaon]
MVCKNFYKGKYYVTYKRGFEDCKKDVIITIDKLFENDSLILTLSDDEDPCFLFKICITRCDYEDLKKQQGLLIDFDNFPSQIVRLLQQCASNNMFLIIHQLNPIKYNFEIVEHNEFKRLVHLSLSTGPATDSDIKQHMAETISNLKKNLAAVKSSSTSTEAILNDKILKMEGKIHDLTHTVTKMEEDKLRRETEFYESLKQEKDRLTQPISKRRSDRNQRINFIENEVQKTHIEVATLRAKNVTLEREINEKDRQINQLQSQCSYLEKVNKESSDSIKELNDAVAMAKKEKESLEKRLSLSESLANKNNDAAHSTAEQLLKANQIISKQNNELIEVKEKLLCRTAIALEQEKVIESYTKEINDLKSEIECTKDGMTEMKNELEKLKEKCENTTQTLKDREETIKNNNMVIQWLHKKIEDQLPNSDRQNFVVQSSSSTPYFVQRNNQGSNKLQESDETINFYATSRNSSLDNSPQVESPQERSRKSGLDPKYLQPAMKDQLTEKSKSTGRSDTASSRSQKGKENKNVELPKVVYKEKKSSSATYRATPSRRTSRTAPIVIRQALHSGDGDITIWGTEIMIVSIVARVRNIRMQSTKITYTIQDITGRMRAVFWLDQEAMEEDDKSTPKVQVNDYVQIYGNVKTNKGKKVLMAFKIMPITDVNAITFHYLQCINNRLKMEADSKKTKINGNTTSSAAMPANSMVGMADSTSVNGLNPRQMMVFNLIRASTLEQGISKQDMYVTLKDRMSQMEFENILEWMCGEGHIYSTIDEEHFRATDAF